MYCGMWSGVHKFVFVLVLFIPLFTKSDVMTAPKQAEAVMTSIPKFVSSIPEKPVAECNPFRNLNEVKCKQS